MPSVSASESVENFVKAVYKLQQESERVSTNALTAELNITAPSVTDMAKRLVDGGLVDYQRYHGVRLTNAGEEMALQIIRRHRLIELYLVSELGYELHEVHDEADQLEHAVSNRFIDAIAAKLGNPQFDPHGDPIPSADGTMANRDLNPLSELAIDVPATVSRFMAMDADMLQHILERGFILNTAIEIVARDPFEGPITIRIGDDTEVVIGHGVAQKILVEVRDS